MRRGSARVPKCVLEFTAFRMMFWLCTVWEASFVLVKPYLHLERVRCRAHASYIDFDLRKPVLLQYQIIIRYLFYYWQKKDLGFTNHLWRVPRWWCGSKSAWPAWTGAVRARSAPSTDDLATRLAINAGVYRWTAEDFFSKNKRGFYHTAISKIQNSCGTRPLPRAKGLKGLKSV
jgi:hypothetical protein